MACLVEREISSANRPETRLDATAGSCQAEPRGINRTPYATVTSIALLGLGPAAYAQNLPSYMEAITGRTASSPADTATKNVLALNTGMFELYDDAHAWHSQAAKERPTCAARRERLTWK